ncbi:MAG TPA: outer membrane beta-barrel protein [Phenylobacterium sp.]
MRKSILVGAFIALATTGAAQAQDWSGPYVGAHAGYGFGSENDGETIGFDTNLDGTANDTVRTSAGANAFSPGFCGGAAFGSLPAGGCDDDENGFEFGARAGYDWQFGRLVVGALLEASRTDVEDSVSAFSTTPAFYTMTRDLRWLAALRVRAGLTLDDRTLLYGTGGVAQGEVRHSFNTNNTANTFVLSDDDEASGWQLGGGVERKVTPDVTLGLEYLYTSLQDDGFTVRARGPAAATNPFIITNANGTDFRRSEEDFELHQVRVTAAYRF